eukprot:GEMP01011772.1.p1 GENE.GEMP01011772.1~~GEMP01011772.1.p1  ORF type:complete len:574 (+),score=138.16 GEMP01011772.1:123-1844(+)
MFFITYFAEVSLALGSEKEKTVTCLHYALEVLRRLQARRGVRADVISYSAAMTACEKGGAPWTVAVGLLRDMQYNAITPNAIAFNACISACEKQHNWHQALALLDEMGTAGVRPDIWSFNACISACEKGGESTRALRLLQHSMKESEVRPTVMTFNACISACEKRRQWQHALRIFHSMQSAPYRLVPDVITFDALMSACEKGRQWGMAVELLGRMDHEYHIKPSAISFNACISACEKAHQWQHALSLLNRMRRNTVAPTAVSYHAAMSACEKGKAGMDIVMHLLDDMGAHRVAPTLMVCNMALRATAVSASGWEQALRILGRMKGGVHRGRATGAEFSNGGIEYNVTPDAVSFDNVIRITARADIGVAVRLEAQQMAAKWARGSAPCFITEPLAAVQLLQTLGPKDAPPIFTEKVGEWVLGQAVKALRQGNTIALRRLGVPNLGPLTRRALDALGIHEFDATAARSKVALIGAPAKCDDVRARDVFAHVKTNAVDRVVRYGFTSTSDALPSVYLDHDRSAHAERQALLQILDAEGDVELYITHRPCISCIAAMAAFQSPRVKLKVMFDELDDD